MSRPLTIGNSTFNFPDAGDPAGWGGEATDAIDALVAEVAKLRGPNDIASDPSFALGDGTTGNIIGMFFDPVVVRGATVNYAVYRETGGVDLSEYGTINLNIRTDAPTNEKITFIQNSVGDAGITFSITDTGQFTYETTSIGATGLIYFSGKAFRT